MYVCCLWTHSITTKSIFVGLLIAICSLAFSLIIPERLAFYCLSGMFGCWIFWRLYIKDLGYACNYPWTIEYLSAWTYQWGCGAGKICLMDFNMVGGAAAVVAVAAVKRSWATTVQTRKRIAEICVQQTRQMHVMRRSMRRRESILCTRAALNERAWVYGGTHTEFRNYLLFSWKQ